jgi:Tol biopolymer transport system component
MAVSPDGSRLVFVALAADGTRHLWLRRFDSVSSRSIDGSDGAQYPFWSPDGRSIAFFAQSKIKKIAEAGGSPQVVCDVQLGGRGGTWSQNGTILFSTYGRALSRVSDAGGVARPATTLNESLKERTHAWPVFLPDGRRFLYLAQSEDREHTAVYQGSLDSTETRRVLTAESNIGLAGTHLLSLRKSSLIAQVYDADRAQVGGEPITVAEQIAYDTPQRSGGGFSVAANNVLAYRSASPDSHLIWFDRTGKEVGSFRAPGDYHHPWLSPDEKRVAIEKTDAATGRHTIWILELSRGITSRLVSDVTGAHGPVWSPDGSRVVYSSNRLGGIDLYWLRADGTGDERVLSSAGKVAYQATDWSLDGRFLLYLAERGQGDLWILPLLPTQKPRPFLESPSDERQGQFSPDARWIAYTSDESGAHEVYVRRFPGADGKWQVSTHGGAQPRWRRDGKELFYLAPDGKLMAAAVKAGLPTFETGTPEALFNTGITASFVERRNHYVVTRDGQRFLVNISAEDENSAPITVVMNWDAALIK